MKNGKFCSFVAVVVTYGSITRCSGVKKTIESVNKAGAKKIFLVNNGCNYDLEKFIKQEFPGSNIKIKSFSTNQGSLVGFCSGISLANQDNDVLATDYILILDDDVMLDEKFKYKFPLIEEKVPKNQTHVWSLFRLGRDQAFDKDYDINKNFYLNSIAGFSFFRRNYRTRRKGELSTPFMIPWAGMFLKKSDLQHFNLPQSDYFVYEDDAEFSLNIRDKGFEIYKSRELFLRESSESWFENNGKPQSGYKLYYENLQEVGRYLYKIRNNVYLVKTRLLTTKWMFYTNIFIFVVAGFIKYGKLNRNGLNKLKLLCGAIKDGLSGNLGMRSDWQL